MAVPTIIAQADLYHRYNRSASIRLVMSESAGEYRIKASTYGVGPLPDCRLPNKIVRAGFESSAFDEELVALEQMNYEVHWQSESRVEGWSFKQLRARPIPSSSVEDVAPSGKQVLPNFLVQKLTAGIRVTVVIDAFSKVAMYDPNQSNTLENGVAPPPKTQHFLKSKLSANKPFSSILEGFYSDRFGLHITDAIVIQGEDVSRKSFVERITLAGAVWGKSELTSAITDRVVMPQAPTRGSLRALAGKNESNPIYLLRSSDSESALLKSSGSLKTLVVDYEAAKDVSLSSAGKTLKWGLFNDPLSPEVECIPPSGLFEYNIARRFVVGGSHLVAPAGYSLAYWKASRTVLTLLIKYFNLSTKF
ncbi:hypothetical protein C9975_05845 [Thalassospira xiamenensis]|nr:hypothetical protein C9975_05845 [Thalassospira xiamenensis]